MIRLANLPKQRACRLPFSDFRSKEWLFAVIRLWGFRSILILVFSEYCHCVMRGTNRGTKELGMSVNVDFAGFLTSSKLQIRLTPLMRDSNLLGLSLLLCLNLGPKWDFSGSNLIWSHKHTHYAGNGPAYTLLLLSLCVRSVKRTADI